MADGAGGTSAKKLGGSEPKKLHIWTRNPRIDTLFWMKSFFGYHLNSKFGTQALGSETGGEALNGDIGLSLKDRKICFLLLLLDRTVLFG